MKPLNHGGKRKNAGRPRINISIARVLKLFEQGLTRTEIANRFEVSDMTIGRIIKREKR
jgi:DNA invertase Pin-like site-specific DNA recombinase